MSRVLPILFNGDMIQAILDGRKTVTRRLVKPQPPHTTHVQYTDGQFSWAFWEDREKHWIHSPYQPGDILYVRETVWQKVGYYLDVDGETKPSWYKEFKYVATDEKPETGWNYSWATRPSIHMPKEAARIFLKVKDVRVERLQEITAEDALNEGAQRYIHLDGSLDEQGTRTSFIGIWNSTIKKSDLDHYGWDANPWVWVIEFERCEKPEFKKDDLPK